MAVVPCVFHSVRRSSREAVAGGNGRGMCFALALYRRGFFADAVVAHGTTRLTLALCVHYGSMVGVVVTGPTKWASQVPEIDGSGVPVVLGFLADGVFILRSRLRSK